MADGATRVAALTHHTIAEYVGTSREIVTFQLNRLRRLGMLRYSRKHMDIYTSAMQEALREQGVELAASPHRIIAARRRFSSARWRRGMPVRLRFYTNPLRIASRTTEAISCTSSLLMMLARCVTAVLKEIPNSAAISLLLFPGHDQRQHLMLAL